MLIAIILIVGMLFTLTADLRIAESDVTISAECLCDRAECLECNWSEESEWAMYHAEAVAEYASEFDALFNSYDVKVAKNGRTMIRSGNTGPYKFAKMGG